VLLVWCVLAMLVVGCVLWTLRTSTIAHEEERLAQVDPFRVLELERRLAVAAERIRRVDADPTMFARAHHLRAALWAYDALLREACEIAGAEQPDVERHAVEVTALQRALSAQDLTEEVSALSTQSLGDPDARFQRELELGARGWSW
jgi:hypothetical protein